MKGGEPCKKWVTVTKQMTRDGIPPGIAITNTFSSDVNVRGRERETGNGKKKNQQNNKWFSLRRSVCCDCRLSGKQTWTKTQEERKNEIMANRVLYQNLDKVKQISAHSETFPAKLGEQ